MRSRSLVKLQGHWNAPAPNNIPVKTGRTLGSANDKRENRSATIVSVASEKYCSDQQAQKAKVESSKLQRQVVQAMVGALPLVTAARRPPEASSEDSANHTTKAFWKQYRRRLQEKKKQMQEHRLANAVREAQAVVDVIPELVCKEVTYRVYSFCHHLTRLP